MSLTTLRTSLPAKPKPSTEAHSLSARILYWGVIVPTLLVSALLEPLFDSKRR